MQHFLHFFNIFGPIGSGSDFDPHPQPQSSLLRIFRLQPGLEWKFLLRRTWSGQKLLPLQFPGLSIPYSGKPGFLVRAFLSDPGSESKISRLGGWGWKNDSDLGQDFLGAPEFRPGGYFSVFVEILGRLDVPSSDAQFPTCACKHAHTMVPAESAKFYRNSDPKHLFFVCKAIWHMFKNKSARIYLCKAIFYTFGIYIPKQKLMYVVVLAGKDYLTCTSFEPYLNLSSAGISNHGSETTAHRT